MSTYVFSLNDISVEAILCQNEPLLIFPCLFLRLYFVQLDLQLFLGVLILL